MSCLVNDESLELRPTMGVGYLASLFFAGGGIFLIFVKHFIFGSIATAFGLLTLSCALWFSFSSKSSLRLTSEGFYFGSAWRRRVRFYRWVDVTGFSMVKLQGSERVAFAFSPAYQKEPP